MSTKNDKPRVNFATVKSPFPYPDFLEVQLKSFRDFFQLDTPPEKRTNEGLYKVFSENFPISDTRNNFQLEFLDYYIDPPRYTIDRLTRLRGRICPPPLSRTLNRQPSWPGSSRRCLSSHQATEECLVSALLQLGPFCR